jgi:hypothetical protein
VTFSKQEKDVELFYHLFPKHTQQAVYINALSLDNKSSATFKLVVISITSEYSRGSFKVSAGASQPCNGALAFTAKLIVALTFEQINNTQPIFQLIDVSITNKDKTGGASQLATNEHKGLIKSKMPFTFQLIVEFKQVHQRKLQNFFG